MWLVSKVNTDLETQKSAVAPSFSGHVTGLQYIIETQLMQLHSAREALLHTVGDLSAEPSTEEVTAAVECHLRPSRKKRDKCKYCTIHEMFNRYESRLFCFTEGAAHVEEQNKEDALLASLRRGNWGDSNLEKIIKSLCKNAAFSDGTIYLHLQVPEQQSRLLVERELHRNDLRKKLGQLFYLQNLEKAGGSGNASSNPEPCPICQNPLGERWSVMQCGHNFCIGCIQMMLRTPACTRGGGLLCAVCRSISAHEDIFFVDVKASKQDAPEFPVKGSHSTKTEGIVRTLLKIKAEDPSAKALVFSTWLVVLDVLRKALEDNDISYILLKSANNSKNNLALFKHDPEVSVLMLPLSLGAKGLNLTEATHVLLIEPILNTADELQAIGRVHRIGQTK
ncbi:snf2 histone linker PHD ring helicase, putative [Ixodes scapularis]|uniref:Snf2 histone linker PHD ring helicase, putative n=1 Tax=Ixodes scapularis TaxID=6945 RepID=B7P6I4_IXOSC|nr:snf2 histone linker PHD ring helicase, putative [Ixodes scapularis]|eukprot:XP_002408840.1 snf2 histone linker PHD ring helicase, putative [Ixodes scapularis]